MKIIAKKWAMTGLLIIGLLMQGCNGGKKEEGVSGEEAFTAGNAAYEEITSQISESLTADTEMNEVLGNFGIRKTLLINIKYFLII